MLACYTCSSSLTHLIGTSTVLVMAMVNPPARKFLGKDTAASVMLKGKKGWGDSRTGLITSWSSRAIDSHSLKDQEQMTEGLLKDLFIEWNKSNKFQKGLYYTWRRF